MTNEGAPDHGALKAQPSVQTNQPPARRSERAALVATPLSASGWHDRALDASHANEEGLSW
jgi:hypothetical protein